MGKPNENGVELLDYTRVPTSVDSENNHNGRTQNKYTVNGTPRGGCVISRPLLFLLIAGMILLLVVSVLATYFLLPGCPHAAEIVQTTTEMMARSEIVDERLPTSLRPTHYRINIMPFIWEGNFTLNGEVTITFNVTEDTNKIILNTNDIIIHEDSVKVTDLDGGDAQILSVMEHQYDAEKQLYTVVLDDMLVTGKLYDVTIKYIGNLNDLLQGFYRISYIDYGAKKIRWMAATQFSPTDARRAFPCFDEPAMKAKFSISLARWKNMTSHSNMKKRAETPIENMDEWVWDHYDETPIMSTYLVAMMVSDLQSYKYNALSNSSQMEFAVWSRREALNQTRFAGTLGPSILEYFNKYFQIPYPLPKLDMVALPDFGFSAMENWGLITFRESSLLFDEKLSTIQSMRDMAMVIGHELGHQWFGNLVTPEWWDDLWLKEGFASYLEYLGVQHVHPSWNILDEFVIEEIQYSFQLDCLLSSHPIHVPVHQTSQIRQIFDTISYKKGASVIRMLNHVLGEYTFKVGLINYLNAKKYDNAYHDDLWETLTTQAHKDGVLDKDITVKQIMDSWILQTGYPVINVTRNYTDNSAIITQERFLLSKNSSDKTTWWIPISYTMGREFNFENTKPRIWMKNESEIVLNNLSSTDWIYVNVKHGGYYRVNYDMENWKMLGINMHQFPHVVRAQLIDDSMNLARAGLLDYEIPFSIVIEAFRDPTYISLTAALRNLRYIDNMLATTPIYGKFKLFMSQLTRRIYETLGFTEKPNDDYGKKMSRSDVLKWSCTFENSDCTIQARQMYRDWMIDETDKKLPSEQVRTVPANLKSVVYCTAIREGREVEWDFAFKKYLTTNIATEKELLLTSLGCASERWLLSSSGIRKQDGKNIFVAVSQNVAGHRLSFDFVRTNWKELNSHYGEAFSTISKMISALPVYMNTPFELAQLEAFKNENINELGTAERAFDQSIEEVHYNVDWMANSYKRIEQWLDDTIRRYRRNMLIENASDAEGG
ncbi:Suppressor of ER stress-induced death [Carabus blaptoides fortunei]